MDYERIQKPHTHQGGGFSPSKLRAMLLGVDKRRNEGDPEPDSRFSLRSEGNEVEDECKDVDIVSPLPERSAPVEIPCGCGHPDSGSSLSAFEFQKTRSTLMPPFSKPAPSKWDDAQKWILNPGTNRASRAGGAQLKKGGVPGCGARQPATKIVMEVVEEAETKRVDQKREAGGEKAADCVPVPCLPVDSCAKTELFVESSVADSAIRLSRHDPSTSQSATTFIAPPSTARAVSMRDMGTEMTPIASQEPSRTGTPARATTPMLSPTSSRPSTPRRSALNSIPVESADYHLDHNKRELSEKELKMKTRREIMMLGTQLGKTNIAAWASKEEEEKDASVSLKTVPADQTAKNLIEARAAAWEEVEKAKYLARFKREEIKIQVWENHQKAKAEAEMKEIEVKVERMKAHVQDKLMNKFAEIRHKAEEKLAAAEAKKNQEAARTALHAEYIRRTGRIPSFFSCWSWCS